MNPESWARVRALYEDALELPPEERRELLDREAEDPEVRREVDELLVLEGVAAEHFSRLAQRVGSSALDAARDAEPERESMRGQMVGPYRVLEELGRGGMGVVYLAERADGAFEHRVAVKLLPVGLPGPPGHQRFLVERQILARLQHPSIARLLDGGLTGDGRPYIVMEYVDGLPIDLWCDAAGMGVDNRIKLFLEVCETIEYAHRNLVVHRDLKPSNVLVTGEAETKLLGQVKLLDFGIAKLLGEDSPELAGDDTGRIPLTPSWASPEQLAGEPVTTATDVYTLAALLYRLLVGVPPHDLRGCSTDQIRKRVLAGRPVPPSRRLERLDRERAERIAACRKSQPEALRRKLRGDLDTILLKGLARKPEARYGSPGALAADLRRHLSGHPVKARPATLGYRLTRFLGRHRTAAVTVTVIAALLTTVIWTAVRYVTGVAAERDRAREATERLVEVFEDTVGLYEHQPEVLTEEYARDLAILATTYDARERPERAASLFERAVDVHREVYGENHRATALMLVRAASFAKDEGRLDRAEELAREAVATARRLPEPDPPTVARADSELASILLARGQVARAEGRD